MKFNAPVEKFENNLWYFHVKVPAQIVLKLKKQGIKRLLCSINNNEAFHASIMPAGNEQYFINLNKDLRKKYDLDVGNVISVSLRPDQSRYGMEMPEEFEEILTQDPEGDHYFHQLTPGKQRSLIYMVAKMKSTDKRILKALVILDHLKEYSGNLDYKILHEDFKNKKYPL